MFAATNGDPMGTMLSALVLMALFLPLSKSIRNMVMGFLQWIGVDEEGVAGRAVGTLMAIGNLARLAGSGWDANIRGGPVPGAGGGQPGTVQASRIPPVGSVPGTTGDSVPGIGGGGSAVVEGVQNITGPGQSISPGINTAVNAGMAAAGTAAKAAAGVNTGSNTAGVAGSRSPGPGKSGAGQGIRMPEAEIPASGIPDGGPGDAPLDGSAGAPEPPVGGQVPPIPEPEPSVSGAGPDEEPAPSVSDVGLSVSGLDRPGIPLRSPLEQDVMDADRTGAIKYARTSAFFAPADHFAPGSSHLYGAMWGNITAAGRLGANMHRSLSEIRRQYPGGGEMKLGEALKLYTRSRSKAGATFKVGAAVAGTALGFGPPVVRRAQFASEIPGKAYRVYQYLRGFRD